MATPSRGSPKLHESGKSEAAALPQALLVPQEAVLGHHLEPVSVEEEWTYPDGGLRAWLVRRNPSSSFRA